MLYGVLEAVFWKDSRCVGWTVDLAAAQPGWTMVAQAKA